MSRFPVRAARGPSRTLHVENMEFFQKQPKNDAKHVSTVEPRSAEYVNHSWSHLPDRSIHLYTSGQTNTRQVTVIYKGPVDEQQHPLSFSSIPAMMSRILGLTTEKEKMEQVALSPVNPAVHCHCCRRRSRRGTQDGVRGCQAPHPLPTTLRS